MADKKPIRWFVPQGGESFMGIAAYYLTHEENMRKSFSQPSRNATMTLPDGTTIDYIMNDVVDCIRISPPQRMQRAVGKKMTWDKLPPFEEGTTTIDLSLMTEDPDVEGGYYCTVSVINGTDENGRSLSATFSVKMSTGSAGWSIEQGIRQTDGTYKVDGKSATLLLGSNVSGECKVYADDGRTRINFTAKVSVATFGILSLLDGVYYWLTFDKNLVYLGAELQDSCSEMPRASETTYSYYRSTEPDGSIVSGIKKSDAFLVGPYSFSADPSPQGCLLLSYLTPQTPYEGSINGHSLINYVLYDYDASSISSYIIINDIETLLITSPDDGSRVLGATLAYSDYCSVISYGDNSGVAYYVLRRLNSDGECKSLDWTSKYSYDDETGYRHINLDGVDYIVTTSLKRIAKT